MPAHPIRVYADTSVYGGVFDEEFAKASRAFFDQVREGRFMLVTSPIVREELVGAPRPVRELAEELWPFVEEVELTEDALRLQRLYIQEGIVPEGYAEDALHVAAAVVSRCDLIVSWNFRHIVHFAKIPLYNAVSLRYGFGRIAIHSPPEVTAREEERV